MRDSLPHMVGNLRKLKYTPTPVDMLHVGPKHVPYCCNTVAPRYFELIYLKDSSIWMGFSVIHVQLSRFPSNSD